MDDITPILNQFQEKVSKKIRLKEKGINRYLVQTPFMFEDGDNLVIIFKFNTDRKQWCLTDEGETFQHLSYFMDSKDLAKGTRKELIETSKKMFSVEEYNSELIIFIPNQDYGNALYNFIQCLLKITDITFLERERIKSTFFEDFTASISQIAKERDLYIKFNGHIEDKDKNKKYQIDCIIESKKNKYYLFAINNDNKCREATINILMYERWNLKFHAVGIFEDQTSIGRQVLAKFSDVCEKQISDLGDIKNRFEKYLDLHS